MWSLELWCPLRGQIELLLGLFHGKADPVALFVHAENDNLDHISDPRGRWAEMEPRKEELGIVLAHVSPSTEGLRLVFVIPQGMSLPEAQAWMARQLGDKEYDASVKDYARCSFAVPRGYVLWVSPFLFRSSEVQECRSSDNSFSGVQELQEFRSSDNSSDYEEQEDIMQAALSSALLSEASLLHS